MRKRNLLIIGVLVISLILPVMTLSCGGNIHASLGEEFTLPAGKTADITGEDLSIKFVEVISDSRCPTGVECVWAGEAKSQMLITLSGSSSEIVLTISGGTSSTAQEVFNQYTFNFTLNPYPEIGQEIAPSDYELVMTVTK